MVIQDFALIILLFIFADIIFYMVIMKGLLFKSITGRTPAEEAAAAKEKAPLFSLELCHTPAVSANLYRRDPAAASGGGGQAAEQLVDFAAIVRQELQNLAIENLRFVPPYNLRVGESRRIEMVVTQNIVPSVTKSLNEAFPSNISPLKVGALMSVSLHAEGFSVTPISEAQQRLGSANLVWAWNIVPLKARNRTLGFDAVLNLKTASGDEKRTYTWRNAEVEVAGNIYFTLKQFLRRRNRASL